MEKKWPKMVLYMRQSLKNTFRSKKIHSQNAAHDQKTSPLSQKNLFTRQFYSPSLLGQPAV